MPGLFSILNTGVRGLFASQAAIEVTSNNIANANTPGYSRQRVRLEESLSVDYHPGQIGLGVDAVEVVRYFNEFVEEQYLDKFSSEQRWQTTYDNLRSIENIFNESNSAGLTTALTQMWEDWENLSLRPENRASREVLLQDAQNFLSILHNIDEEMDYLQRQMDAYLTAEIDDINNLIKDIGEINRQLNIHDDPGRNNANALYDMRTNLVRKLAEKIDITTVDKGGSDFTILMHPGVLVDGIQTHELQFEPSRSFKALEINSPFEGDVYFSGEDDFEYTLEFLNAGESVISSNAALSTGLAAIGSNGGMYVANADGTASMTALSSASGFFSLDANGMLNATSNAGEFRLSLDGGRTWVLDENGTQKTFTARMGDEPTLVGELQVWFGSETDELGFPRGNFSTGDTFTLVPKHNVYWYETTASPLNITPQTYANGEDNPFRMQGGELAGMLNFRDQFVGRYRDRLDAFANSLSWEVNRVHSQGMGLERFQNLLSANPVTFSHIPLGDPRSGADFSERLQAGNTMVYIYDRQTGDLALPDSYGPLDFSDEAGVQQFDPAVHSLTDVRDAYNRTFGDFLTADIFHNQLQITAHEDFDIAFGTDSSGLNTSLGINTFFTGTDARSLQVHERIISDLDFIATGHVNGQFEMNPGDNKTTLELGRLSTKNVQVSTLWEGTTNTQTLNEYYTSLVAVVGGDTANAQFNAEYFRTLSADLSERQAEVAGINMDEEYKNLVQFQHSYTAAAKVITTADSMIQTVLGLKN